MGNLQQRIAKLEAAAGVAQVRVFLVDVDPDTGAEVWHLGPERLASAPEVTESDIVIRFTGNISSEMVG